MKKRKIKLFASVASLAMVAAVMGVGVWAATTQSVTINSTVEFSATAILGTVTLYADGAATATATLGSDIKGEAKAAEVLKIDELTEANGAQTAKDVAITLADSNTDGYFDEQDGTITYTFTITNDGDEALFYNVKVGQATTIADPAGTWTASGAATNKTEAGLAKDASRSVTITFTYEGADQTKIANTVTLPTVTVELGNKNVAQTWQ
ncbi:MAG: hypothetical protein ACLRFR_00840 [Clostridia bacterium]